MSVASRPREARRPGGRTLGVALAAAAVLSGALGAPPALAAKVIDVRVSAMATQTTERTSTGCGSGETTATGVRTEELVLRTQRPGRFLLKPGNVLSRAGAFPSGSMTVTRTSTMGVDGVPLACRTGAAPEPCRPQTVPARPSPSLLSTYQGKLRGLLLEADRYGSTRTAEACGTATVSLLAPPITALGPAPPGADIGPTPRYTYAPLPAGLRRGCGKRTFVTKGSARFTQRGEQETSVSRLDFTLTITRTGCLGRF